MKSPENFAKKTRFLIFSEWELTNKKAWVRISSLQILHENGVKAMPGWLLVPDPTLKCQVVCVLDAEL